MDLCQTGEESWSDQNCPRKRELPRGKITRMGYQERMYRANGIQFRHFLQPLSAGINNGKPESVEDIAKYLSDVLEQLNRGAPLGISSKVTNIRTGVSGLLGWATYDGEHKLGSGGVVLQTTQGPCTTLFRKQGETWLIQHEHCSTASQFPFAR
jgi:hypothetical protein